MYRIDDPTASTTLPTPEAALTEGYFTEGNPGTGTPATLERASWFNMVQEELRAVVVAAGLTPSKTTYTQIRDAISQMYSPGRFLGMQVFTASGTYTPGTYTVGGRSVTATKARVRLWGGGGAGGSVSSASGTQGSVASGGNAGSFIEFWIISGLTSQVVTIGAAGVPSAAGFNVGGTGGSTSLGALAVAVGGRGGNAGAGGTPPGMTTTPVPNAINSGSATFSINQGGQLGSFGVAASTVSVQGGQGGSSSSGAGGAGAGGGAGSPATGNGAGGGGAGVGASGSANVGGAGSPGNMIIEEFA